MKVLLIELAAAIAAECAYHYIKRHTGIQAKLNKVFSNRLQEAKANLAK